MFNNLTDFFFLEERKISTPELEHIFQQLTDMLSSSKFEISRIEQKRLQALLDEANILPEGEKSSL